MKLIGLTGFARSGKDTVGQRLINEHGYERVGFADAVRDAVYTLNPLIPDPWTNPDCTEPGAAAIQLRTWVDAVGWERAKAEVPEVRRLLQVMGTEVGREIFGQDTWTNIGMRKIAEIVSAQGEGLVVGAVGKVVVTDVRFANEADVIHDLGGKVWKIEREGYGPINAHASETLDFEVDGWILNDSDLAALYARVDALLRSTV